MNSQVKKYQLIFKYVTRSSTFSQLKNLYLKRSKVSFLYIRFTRLIIPYVGKDLGI